MTDESGWQPLKSAPKDRPFWVWNEFRQTITKARHYTAADFAQMEGGRAEDWDDHFCEFADPTETIEYGLWIDLDALPAPPEPSS